MRRSPRRIGQPLLILLNPHQHQAPDLETTMRLLIALFLPWLTFFTIGKPISGIVCLILQLTLIGWIPATIWAVYALSQYKTDQKIAKALADRRSI